MVDSISVIRIIDIVGTVLLGTVLLISLLGYCFIFGYTYFNIRYIYSNRERRYGFGLLAFLLPFTGLLAGVVILMIWKPLTRSLFLPLVIFSVFLSVILWQSIVSPYQMAEWWGKLGAWLKKRNKKV